MRSRSSTESHAATGGGGVATATRTSTTTATRPVLLVVSWTVVGLPLAYGVYQTVVKVVGLFG